MKKNSPFLKLNDKDQLRLGSANVFIQSVINKVEVLGKDDEKFIVYDPRVVTDLNDEKTKISEYLIKEFEKDVVPEITLKINEDDKLI